MKEYILAIDQGTTSTRVIVFDKNQSIVYSTQKEINCVYPEDGWVEVDAGEIYLSVLYCLGQVLQNTDIKPEMIKAIGISDQRETTVMWNKKTGIPVYNAIVWQSRQSAEIVDRYKAMGVSDLIKAKTGLILDPYFSATKICWLYERFPEMRDDEDIIFGTIDTWLTYNLTGQTSHFTDPTNAARTLLFNIHTMDWDDELLELFNIPRRILPAVKDSSDYFGDVAGIYGLTCPIMSLIGDQQAALFGESCFSRGDIKNTYGTGGFILVNTAEEIINSAKGSLATVAWRIDGKTTYALEGSIFVSGSLIQWLRDGLRIIDDAPSSEKLARTVKDAGGVIIIPAFTGLGAPYWNEESRGSIFGLTRATSKGHIARAALEAMAYQVYDLLLVMQEETGIKFKSLRVDGGASANDLLLQIQSDIANIEVKRQENFEATALGAARLAGLKIGYYSFDDFTEVKETSFFPSADAKTLQAGHKRWKRAIEATIAYTAED